MQPPLLYGYVDTPIGTVEIGVQADHVAHLFFVDSRPQKDAPTNRILQLAIEQVAAYFKGRLKKFDLPLGYNKEADEKSWQAMRIFFIDIF